MLTLAALCLALSGSGFADLYNNGPTLGTANALFIDVYAVPNSFVVNPETQGVLQAVIFAEWVPTGATPLTVEWSVGTSSFGSNVANGTGQIAPSLLCRNGQPILGGLCGSGLGYDVYSSTVTFPGGGIFLNEGTYWLTLTNATDNFGGRDGWDVNSGPSITNHRSSK